jgi:hypothetical protein
MNVEDAARLAAARMVAASLRRDQEAYENAVAALLTGNPEADARASEELMNALVGYAQHVLVLASSSPEEAAEYADDLALEIQAQQLGIEIPEAERA